MERKEVAKAATQTEDAEKSLELLRESYMSYKAQSTQQVYHRIYHDRFNTCKRYWNITIISYLFFFLGLGISK